MAAERDLQPVFTSPKAFMQPLEEALVLKTDQPGRYYLDSHRRRADGYVFAFGGVEIKKNYVSYHLAPVYEHPALLEGISERLLKRMQGKSCFNFTTLEPDLLIELRELTTRALALTSQSVSLS
jgi:hypothetical protein